MPRRYLIEFTKKEEVRLWGSKRDSNPRSLFRKSLVTSVSSSTGGKTKVGWRGGKHKVLWASERGRTGRTKELSNLVQTSRRKKRNCKKGKVEKRTNGTFLLATRYNLHKQRRGGKKNKG